MSKVKIAPNKADLVSSIRSEKEIHECSELCSVRDKNSVFISRYELLPRSHIVRGE
jgi:hypothetical protein